MKFFTLISILLLTSCIKTAEQIRREKQMDNISQQVNDSQGLFADMTNSVKETQTRIDQLNGRVEELEFKQSQLSGEKVNTLFTDVELLKEQVKGLQEELAKANKKNKKLNKELKSQQSYIKKVNSSLAKMNEGPDYKSIIYAARSLAKKGQISQAKAKIKDIPFSELSAVEKNRLYQTQGIIDYTEKNYQKAIVSFSKVYTKYPKASIAPNCLYYIAKSLEKMGQKDEAQAAFQELKEKYPKSSEAKKL